MKLPLGDENKAIADLEKMDLINDPLDKIIKTVVLLRCTTSSGKTHAAKSLGISRATMYRYLKSYGDN